jgi:starch-binding outer membrane protein SusE/F
MKRINKLIVFGLLFMTSWGCKKEIDDIMINPNATLVATLSSPTAVLLKANSAADAFTVQWTTPDYGFQAAPAYSVLIIKKGGDFSKATPIGVGSDLKKVFKTADFNNTLLGFGFLPNVSGDIQIKVEALIGVATKLSSTILDLKATPYLDKLDPTTTWGVVGDATPNGWNGPDMPMYKLLDVNKNPVPNKLVAYVSVLDGALKFRRNNDWAVNLGSSGTVEPDLNPAGTLAANGKNLGIKKGSYKITIDTTANTYKIEAFTLGVVGDATANGWNGPDQPLAYEAATDTWKGIVTVIDGAMKFRMNNDWAVNYGSTASTEPDPILAAGGLAAGGKNFGVKKGTYLVTLDLNTLKYTFVAFKKWGLVGDATAGGWNGPDQDFTYDFNAKKWILNNVVLIAGAVKFREGNDWANNLGATGTVEPFPIVTTAGGSPMIAGGKNFGVTAGTWSFELDLNDAANPKYRATKK